MRRSDGGPGAAVRLLLVSLAVSGLLTGCGTFSSSVSVDSALLAGQQPRDGEATASDDWMAQAVADDSAPAVVDSPEDREAAAPSAQSDVLTRVNGSIDGSELIQVSGAIVDQAGDSGGSALVQQLKDELSDTEAEEYDPWEPFNEKMFTFNRNVDKYVLKPVAFAYNHVMPEPWQVMISNGFDNIRFVPRFVNNLLQGKWGGAARELGRFLINSTAGIGGLFDPAKDYWGIPKSSEDFGQTLGVWGAGPGPYLVLPFSEPLTVRDGVGRLVDSFMNPLGYFIPFIWDGLAMRIGDVINDRALNYDLFQGFEESVVDMYSAVRHGYLQRRERLIKE